MMGEFLRRPVKPTKQLNIGESLTDAEIIKHYAMMLNYWIAEAKWQEARVAGLLAIRTKWSDRMAPDVTFTSGADSAGISDHSSDEQK